MPATQEIIHEIQVERARLDIIVRMADMALEESDVIAEYINERREQNRAETEEAFDVLRRAGLLRG